MLVFYISSPALHHKVINLPGASWGRSQSVPTVNHSHYLSCGGYTVIVMQCSWFTLKTLPPYCHMSQKVCVPDSISHTWHSQSSTHHWQWSTSCNEVPTIIERSINSYYLRHQMLVQSSVVWIMTMSYLGCCPFDGDFPSMRNVVVPVLQVSRQTKVTNLFQGSKCV